ncbi:hypothetical protein ES708_23551 [subsurface metagenome]
MVGSHQRTPLLDVLPQYLAQGKLEEVGSGVIAGDIHSPLPIHYCLDLLPDFQTAFDDFTLVQCCIRRSVRTINGIGHHKTPTRPDYFTGIAYLTTHFSIERSFAQDDSCLLTLHNSIYLLSIKDSFFYVYPLIEIPFFLIIITNKLGRFNKNSIKTSLSLRLSSSPPLPLLTHLPLKTI